MFVKPRPMQRREVLQLLSYVLLDFDDVLGIRDVSFGAEVEALLGRAKGWRKLAIAIAALINIAPAAGLGWWARHLVSEMPFTALLRQLRGQAPKDPHQASDERHR